MNHFVFYSPTMFVFGDGEAKRTGELVKDFGGTNVLLVYGGGSVKKNGAYDAVTASLASAGVSWCELDGILPNPMSDKVYEGISLVREKGVDFILAVGGGSVIDTAKAIGFGALYDGDFWDIFARKASIDACLPVGAVVTISAAGSEGSDSSVITHEDGMMKWGSPRSDLIRPKFAVMDPVYTTTLPAWQTACGAVDMFAHVAERYFTNTTDVALTDRLCEALMKTVVKTAPKALADPTAYAPRADLMWTGMLAHNNSCGVGREHDWASHQIEHELSSFSGCAHGAGMAVVLPAWMDFVMDHDVARFVRFAVEVFGCPLDAEHPEETAKAGIDALRAFFRSLGMPEKLKDLDETLEKKIPAMVAHRAEKPQGFPFGAFVKIGPDEMEQILRACV